MRITAGEIRKRLAQYYGEPGHEHQLRVELPLGSYAPLFSRPEPNRRGFDTVPQAQQTRAEQPRAFSLQEPSPPAAEVAAEPAAVSAPVRNGIQAVAWVLALLAILTTLGLVAYLAQSALTRHRERGLSAFWQPVFHAEGPALIVIGVHAFGQDGKDLSPMSGEAQKGTMLASMTSANMVPISDLISYSDITDLLTTHAHPYRTQSAAQTTFEQLQPGPVVLIGGLDNIWTIRLLAPLRFHFGGQYTTDGVIEDAARPGTEWRFNNAQSSHSNSQDYAIVARFFDPAIEQRVVVAAGIGKSGTTAATRFLTNTRQLQAWIAKTPWKPGGNVELVLATEIVEGEQGPAHVVASYTW